MMAERDQEFYSFYKTHVNKLLNYAMGFLKSRVETEEAVQEIFVKYWSNRHRIINADAHEAYLFNTAYNHLITCLKKKIKEQQRTVPLESINSDVAQSEHADDRLILTEQLQVVNAIVRSLSPQKKLVYELKCTKEHTNQKIADQLGLSVSMVEKHWRQISQLIKDGLELPKHG